MIIRNPIQCTSCDTKILTRTQVGHKDRQEHSFPCPNCGIVISYVLDLDQQKGKSSFREPKNGHWLQSEKGTTQTLTFSDEIPVPANLPKDLSPFIATFGHFQDYAEYGNDEGFRQVFCKRFFDHAERCRTHFERGNWKLFDQESEPRPGQPLTVKDRLVDLDNFLTAGFSKFTLNNRAKHDRVMQRLTFAKTRRQALFDQLAEQYLKAGKILSLWREIGSVRSSFIRKYDSIQPLFQLLLLARSTEESWGHSTHR